MSGVPQQSEYHDVPQNPCEDPHESPRSGRETHHQDQPDQPDQPSGHGGLSLDPTDLLKGAHVDLSLPVSVEASTGESGGGDGNGLSLLSFDSDADALVNLATHDAGATIDVGSLLNAAVLDIGGPSVTESFAHCDAYDGNVPLAGDLSSALGATLDHLTTSSSLFDVPALDILCLDGLDT
jgi:hypothetical protein